MSVRINASDRTLTIANAFHILQGTFPSMIGTIFGVIDVDDGFIHRIWLHGYVEMATTTMIAVGESESMIVMDGRLHKCRNNGRDGGQERGEE